MFAWIEQERELAAPALTVRAQVVSPNDNGVLLWDAFMPRQDVGSVKLRSIQQAEFRPTADRREWGARGRLIHERTPNVDELEMVPIESYFTLGEREIQDLEERTAGNQQLFRDLVGVDIPTRTDRLAEANYRRVEVDVMSTWALNQITARNPQTGVTDTFSFNFAAERYQAAGAEWTGADGAGTAFREFVAWLEDAYAMVGGVGVGVMLRQRVRNRVRDSAPVAVGRDPWTTAGIEARIQDMLGQPFRFYVNERTVDIYTGAGLETQRVFVWPQGRVAVVPQGERVGTTAFAPVARAYDISRAVPQAGIDVRGNTVYHEIANAGRQLTTECQLNAMPNPEERLMAVMDSLIR